MQISSYNPLTLPLPLLAQVNANAEVGGDGTASLSTASQTPGTSTAVTQTSAMPSPAESAFAATLAVHCLSPEQVPSDLSTVPVAGLGSQAYQYALSHGGVNPAEWLSPSDISLFEKVTGGTIKDGVIYDKSGVAYGSKSDSDLVNALCDMRNCGTFSANSQLQMVQGAITVNDIQGYINHYAAKTTPNPINIDILNSAIDTLQKQQA
jgi:hypothetical protein